MVGPAALVADVLATLEDAGHITPRCAVCVSTVYQDAIAVAAKVAADPAWRPSTSHTPSLFCERDRRPHCTCGPCLGLVERLEALAIPPESVVSRV